MQKEEGGVVVGGCDPSCCRYLRASEPYVSGSAAQETVPAEVLAPLQDVESMGRRIAKQQRSMCGVNT